MEQTLLEGKPVQKTKTRPKLFWLGLILTFLCSTLSFGYNYWLPEQMFWDENYHIASAYKYINGVFFMEQHPPLGKLLIAFAEKIWGGNNALDTSKFLEVDHIDDIPKGFSFLALRFPGVIFAILSSVVFYQILFLILSNGFLAWLCSLLFVLDNAIILQSRSAMLEAPQLFFIFIALYLYFRSVLLNKSGWPTWILFGIVFGAAISIKLNSAIILLLIIFMGFAELKRQSKFSILCKISTALMIAFIILVSSYYAHFRLARRIMGKDYEVSSGYKEILKSNNSSLSAFIATAYDFTEFIDRYNSGVPRLKGDTPKENGSHPIFWPLGKKSISYRWDKTSDGEVKYLKLQCNPCGWFLALLSIITAISAISARRLYSVNFSDKTTYFLMESSALIYLSYMLVMFNMGRVMYLYHYFIPLCLCFIIGILFLRLKFPEERFSMKFSFCISCLALAQIICFFYFMPFTYHLPLSAQEFVDRSWLEIWRNELILW